MKAQVDMMRLIRERELMAQEILNLTSQPILYFPPLTGKYANSVSHALIVPPTTSANFISTSTPFSNAHSNSSSPMPSVVSVGAQIVVTSASKSQFVGHTLANTGTQTSVFSIAVICIPMSYPWATGIPSMSSISISTSQPHVNTLPINTNQARTSQQQGPKQQQNMVSNKFNRLGYGGGLPPSQFPLQLPYFPLPHYPPYNTMGRNNAYQQYLQFLQYQQHVAQQYQ